MTNDKKYTPAIISESHTVYTIPLYQRLFEWGEVQINGLMEDLYGQFTQNSEKDYYIGMLTATTDEELVDGQQRFTVVMLIGIAMHQMTSDVTHNSPWCRFLSLDGGYHQGIRLRFKARPYDEEYLAHLASGGSFSKENEKMKRGLEYIKSFLKEIPQEELRAFSEYVYKHLSFFISHLPDEYEGEDLNKYFETMNAGGKGLENHEILKVELLRNADDQERKTRIWNKVSQMDKLMLWRSKDFSQDYLRNETFVHFSRKEITVDDSPSDNKQSQTILEIIDGIGNTIPEKPKQNEKESDDYAVVSFPEFLLLVLDLTVNADTDSENFSYDTSKLLETFDTKLISKKDNELVTEFYNNLYWYRLLLDLFVIRVQKSDESNNAREYELPFGSHNSLKQYQSMLYVSTTYHRWLKPFLKELKKRLENVQQMPSAEDLLAFLKQTDNALRDNNSIQPNNMTYGNIDRYWFWRLDYYLWEMNEKAGKKDEAISKYVFRANRSIEHLHPQNQSENDEWDKKHIDSFGNLAMISSGFNSTQSNDPVGVKFSRIKDQHDKRQLQSIKLWKMYELANGSDLHWTLKLTEKHQKEMLEILRNSFPPTTNS